MTPFDALSLLLQAKYHPTDARACTLQDLHQIPREVWEKHHDAFRRQLKEAPVLDYMTFKFEKKPELFHQYKRDPAFLFFLVAMRHEDAGFFKAHIGPLLIALALTLKDEDLASLLRGFHDPFLLLALAQRLPYDTWKGLGIEIHDQPLLFQLCCQALMNPDPCLYEHLSPLIKDRSMTDSTGMSLDQLEKALR